MIDSQVELIKVKNELALEIFDRFSNMDKNNKIGLGIAIIGIGVSIGGSIILGALLEKDDQNV